MTFKQSRSAGILRLKHQREATEATDEAMSQERGRFEAIAKKPRTRAISSFNLFQTPAPLAQRMARELGDIAGKRVLEPSAGLGRLYRAIEHEGAREIVLVEEHSECCRELYLQGATAIYQRDFLTMATDDIGTFDAILMNPPFKLGRDVQHIKHAYSLLNPGGKIVSLCYDGMKQNKNLKPMVDSWELLPPNTFKSEGTRASVAMITWRKPA